MLDPMMQDAIQIIQTMMKHFENNERNALGSFNEMASYCCEAMQERYGGLWNSTVAVLGFEGVHVQQKPGFTIGVIIDGLEVFLYQGHAEEFP